MTTIKRKQLDAVLAGYVRVGAFTANGASNNATSAITTVLSTAGRAGVSVPLQVSANEEGVGIVATSPGNRVEIYDATTKGKLKDSAGNEVYARLTHSAGVYTLTYFSQVGGTETAYTFPSTSVDFEFVYRFDFARLPAEFAVSSKVRNVSDDPATSGGSLQRELLTPTAANTLPNLSKTPTSAASLTLIVNGQSIDTFGGAGAPFSLSGRAITWNAANAWTLETTDRVVAQYTTNE